MDAKLSSQIIPSLDRWFDFKHFLQVRFLRLAKHTASIFPNRRGRPLAVELRLSLLHFKSRNAFGENGRPELVETRFHLRFTFQAFNCFL